MESCLTIEDGRIKRKCNNECGAIHITNNGDAIEFESIDLEITLNGKTFYIIKKQKVAC